MNSSKLVGIVLTVVGIGIAIIAGLWLASQASAGTSSGGVIIGAEIPQHAVHLGRGLAAAPGPRDGEGEGDAGGRKHDVAARAPDPSMEIERQAIDGKSAALRVGLRGDGPGQLRLEDIDAGRE